MLSTLRNAWKIPELRKRLLWTLLIVAIYRIGNHIPVPGIDPTKLKGVAESSRINKLLWLNIWWSTK